MEAREEDISALRGDHSRMMQHVTYLEGSLKDSNKDIDAVRADLTEGLAGANVTGKISALEVAVEGLKRKEDHLAKGDDDLRQQIRTMGEQFKEITKEFDRANGMMNNIERDLNENKNTTKGLGKNMREMSIVVVKLHENFDSMKVSVTDNQEMARRNAQNIQDNRDSMKELASKLETTQDQLETTSILVGQTKDVLDSTNSTIRKLNDSHELSAETLRTLRVDVDRTTKVAEVCDAGLKLTNQSLMPNVMMHDSCPLFLGTKKQINPRSEDHELGGIARYIPQAASLKKKPAPAPQKSYTARRECSLLRLQLFV